MKVLKRIAKQILVLWVMSWAMAIIAATFLALPSFIYLVERIYNNAPVNDFIEKWMVEGFYHFGPLWYLLSGIALGIIVMVKALHLARENKL